MGSQRGCSVGKVFVWISLVAVGSCGGKSDSDTSAGRGRLELLAGATGGPGNLDGPAGVARFEDPWTIESDGVDRLYVSDNERIRQVDASTGAVTTIAEPGSAGGLAADGNGYLYLADSGNDVIRVIDLESGEVSTLAGAEYETGATDGPARDARFNRPMDVAWDGAGSLFVADGENFTIRQVDLATEQVTTLAGSPGVSDSADGVGAAASFDTPMALASDRAGQLYVLEASQNVRKIDVATGKVSTIVPTGEPFSYFGYSGFIDLTVNAASGFIYLVDNFGEMIVRLDPDSGAVTALAGQIASEFGYIGWRHADGVGSAALFASPHSLASDHQGNLYVVDRGNYALRRVEEATGAVTTLAGVPPRRGAEDDVRGAARFVLPTGLASDGAGSVFVADQSSNTIRQIVLATGEVSTLAGTVFVPSNADGVGTEAGFYAPTSLASDGEGGLYVADLTNGAIRKIDVANREVSTLVRFSDTAFKSELIAPHNLALDGAGQLYVTGSPTNSAVYAIDIASGEISLLAGSAGEQGDSDGIGGEARFYVPQGLAVDGADKLYVADAMNSQIRAIDLSTQEVTTLALSPEESLDHPVALALDGQGHLYALDDWDFTVKRIVLATGTVTTVVGSAGLGTVQLGALPGALSEPQGLAVLPTGDLVISADSAVLQALF